MSLRLVDVTGDTYSSTFDDHARPWRLLRNAAYVPSTRARSYLVMYFEVILVAAGFAPAEEDDDDAALSAWRNSVAFTLLMLDNDKK